MRGKKDPYTRTRRHATMYLLPSYNCQHGRHPSWTLGSTIQTAHCHSNLRIQGYAGQTAPMSLDTPKEHYNDPVPHYQETVYLRRQQKSRRHSPHDAAKVTSHQYALWAELVSAARPADLQKIITSGLSGTGKVLRSESGLVESLRYCFSLLVIRLAGSSQVIRKLRGSFRVLQLFSKASCPEYCARF